MKYVSLVIEVTRCCGYSLLTEVVLISLHVVIDQADVAIYYLYARYDSTFARRSYDQVRHDIGLRRVYSAPQCQHNDFSKSVFGQRSHTVNGE